MRESSNNYPLYTSYPCDNHHSMTYGVSLPALTSLGKRPREEQAPTLPGLGDLILSGDFGRESYDRHFRIKRHEAIQASSMQYYNATQGFYNNSRIDTQVINGLMHDPFFAQSSHSGNASSQYQFGFGPVGSRTRNFTRNPNSQVSQSSHVIPSSAPQKPRADQVTARENSNETTTSRR